MSQPRYKQIAAELYKSLDGILWAAEQHWQDRLPGSIADEKLEIAKALLKEHKGRFLNGQ